MKANYLIILSVFVLLVWSICTPASSTGSSAASWQMIASDDAVSIEQMATNVEMSPHNQYTLNVRITNLASKKSVQQALIKNLSEDWLESHSEYAYQDGNLRVSIEGTNLIAQENKDPKQEAFKILKCFRLNAAKTSFSTVKCASN